MSKAVEKGAANMHPEMTGVKVSSFVALFVF